MSLSNEHIGSKILVKIKIYILTRAELLFTLCYEIPCSIPTFTQNRADIKYIKFEILQIMSPLEDVKFSNVRGLYLRKYGMQDNKNFSYVGIYLLKLFNIHFHPLVYALGRSLIHALDKIIRWQLHITSNKLIWLKKISNRMHGL